MVLVLTSMNYIFSDICEKFQVDCFKIYTSFFGVLQILCTLTHFFIYAMSHLNYKDMKGESDMLSCLNSQIISKSIDR